MDENQGYFGALLDRSLQAEQRKRRWQTILFFLLVILGAGAYLWRAQFGIDLVAEVSSVAPAWKLYSLGDTPFADEARKSLQQTDLLNYLLLRPLLPFEILTIRWSAIAFYSLLLACYVFVAFRRNLGITAILCFLVCLGADAALSPSWSAQWWTRAFLMLHHILILLLARSKKSTGILLAALTAGASFGIATVADNGLLVAFFLSALLFPFLMQPKRDLLLGRWKVGLAYVMGGVLFIAIDLFFLLTPAVWDDWFPGFLKTFSFAQTQSHAENFVNFVFFRPEFWLVLLVSFLFNPDAAWAESFGRLGAKIGVHSRRWLLIPLVLFFVSVFLMGTKKDEGFLFLIGTSMAGAFILFCHGWIVKRQHEIFLVFSSLISVTALALLSPEPKDVLVWISPLILVPFLGLQAEECALRLRARDFQGVWEEGYGHAILLVVVLLSGAGIYHHQWENGVNDASVGSCKVETSVPALKGLKTTAERQHLLSQLSQVLQGSQFVLTYPANPAALLVSDTRSSLDILVPHPDHFDDTEGALLTMWERRRLPDIILYTKIPPEQWGIMRGGGILPDLSGPLGKFTVCARRDRLVETDAFEAFSVNREKIESCVQQIRKVARAELGY